MLLSALLVCLFSAVAFALKAGDFVEINHPGHADHGKICVVEQPVYFHPKKPGVPLVALFIFHDENIKRYGDEDIGLKQIIQYLALPEEQLITIEPSFLLAPLFPDQRSRLAQLIVDNVQGDAENLGKEKTRLKHRLIGAWINFVYENEGMVEVCDALPPSLRRTAEYFWNGIGDFLG